LSSLDFYSLLKVFSGFLFSALFLQSGFDKLIDFKGNRAWIASYFEKSPFRSFSTVLFMLLTLAELAAGLASILGAVSYMFVQLVWLLQTGIALSALALLFIFVGQRVAKDYASAANTIAYIAAAMLAWYIVSK
jgi:hypothetical protein